MQVTETLSHGLKREYDVLLTAGDLAQRFDAQINDLKGKVKINGFRPGKVPLTHLKKVYGRSVMAEVVQDAINSANRKIIDDHGLRLAQEPRIQLPEDSSAVEAVLEARSDLSFKVALEVLPKIEVGELSDVHLERLVADVEDKDIDEGVQRIADRSRTYVDKHEGAKAEAHDRVTVDFEGKVDGVPFEGGKGENIEVVLGSKTFIPGFEDELLGVTAGERRLVKATFPELYANRKLAGRVGEFDVTVKAVAGAEPMVINDEFAVKNGFESLEALRKLLRTQHEAEYARASREKLKRGLLDVLDKRHSFELPQGLVDQEFTSIWTQVEREQTSSGRTFADENTTEEAARAEYRGIAERRVRLGLLLAEIGSKAEVKITDQEMTNALMARSRMFPGQEKQVWEFYRSNNAALAELRAPIFEEKVVDHILTLTKVAERKVSAAELTKPEDDDKPAVGV